MDKAAASCDDGHGAGYLVAFGATSSDYAEIAAEVAKLFIERFAVVCKVIEWTITFEEFCERLGKKSPSAPGPDGIPYVYYINGPI